MTHDKSKHKPSSTQFEFSLLLYSTQESSG